MYELILKSDVLYPVTNLLFARYFRPFFFLLLLGVVQGCLISTAQCLFSRIILVLEDTVKILDIYHNYPVVVESVMELFVECGRRMLCFLTPVCQSY